MAMTNCRECKAPVSTAAKVCPSCGIPRPQRRKVGPVGLVAAASVGVVAFMLASPSEHPSAAGSPSATAQATPNPPAPDAETLRRENDAARRALIPTLPKKQAQALLRDHYEALCREIDSNFNYVRAEVRGSSLYCVHKLYTSYSLAAGPRAKIIEAWVNQWQTELKAAGIKRVGVHGEGEYGSGSHFEL